MAIAKTAGTVGNPGAGAVTAHDVSAAGLNFIANFEGCVLHPYDDGGRPGVGNATIGVGHLIHMGPCVPQDFKTYANFTRAQALDLLHTDAEKAVSAVLSIGVPFTQPELDALTSFAFNCGGGALMGGIAHALHAGSPVAAMQVLQEYTHAGSVSLPGLVRRRAAEAHLFLQGVYC